MQRPVLGTSSLALASLLIQLHLGLVSSSVYRDPSLVTNREPSSTRYYEAFGTKLYDPQGRLLQLEYALEATRKGGAAVGAVSKNLGVVTLWRPVMSKRQAKSIDQPALGVWGGHPDQGCSHLAMAATGVATDIMVLSQYVRHECDSHKFIFGSPIRLDRLLPLIAQEVYRIEQTSKHPAAVDMLLCGADERGVRLFNLGPAGVFDSYQAYGIGVNGQAAKLVLNEEVGRLKQGATLRELLTAVMRALLKTMPSVQENDGEAAKPGTEEDVTVMVIVGGETPKAVPLEVRQYYHVPKGEGQNQRRVIELSLPAELTGYYETPPHRRARP